MSEVRFVCTDRGAHPLLVLGRWTVDEDGRARRVDLDDLSEGDVTPQLFMRAAHRNAAYIARVQAQGEERGLATLDEKCRRCGRGPQIKAADFGRLVAGMIAIGATEFDISGDRTH